MTKRTFFYYGTSLVSGYIILSLELLGFRLLAPFFGYSIYVFGSLIGVILLSLSVGYLLGGYLGDRNMTERLFFFIFLFAGAYLFVMSLHHQRILDSLFRLHIVAGSLLATLILFAVPMVILASLCPYVIKILSVNQKQRIGISAGSIYAVSTIGSLIGTFFTSFYLVPTFGAEKTLISDVILMFVVALAWLLSNLPKGKKYLTGLVLLALLFQNQSESPSRKVIAQTDSPYSHLEVIDYGDFLGLRTDRRSKLVCSFYPKDGRWPYRFLVYDLFAVPPLLNGAKTGLLLGLGAGSIPLLHHEVNPDLTITGVEIDQKIVELGRRYFHLEHRTNTQVVIADVRPFLRQEPTQYDLIEVDLFRGDGEIPFYLATKEFFNLTLQRLTYRGLLAMNVYDPSVNKKIVGPLMNTIAAVYPHTYYVSTPRGSYFVLASKQPLDYRQLEEKILTTSDERLRKVIAFFKNQLTPAPFSPSERVFTDDWAPLEKLSYEAIFGVR